ncbi:MAG: hypothetical protein JRI91_13290 [Deltaproteobacteria bacterium]|nr:hypothetical protein [Deltaproteobacteria bacterium]
MMSKHDDMEVKHWEKRPEPNWEKFGFKQPYQKGLNRLKEDVLAKTNYDPTVLWQWGTMQAMAVIEILKAIEGKFGREGQQIVCDSLKRVGYNIGSQITEGMTIPEDISTVEWISFFATIINRIAYASLETPEIEGEERANFHIDWCPHQDHYKAMDCRVQRYFVQGMIDAAMNFAKSQGRDDVWDVAFRTTIPSGSKTCYFEVYKGNPEETRKWAEYTRLIEDKALEIAKKNNSC